MSDHEIDMRNFKVYGPNSPPFAQEWLKKLAVYEFNAKTGLKNKADKPLRTPTVTATATEGVHTSYNQATWRCWRGHCPRSRRREDLESRGPAGA